MRDDLLGQHYTGLSVATVLSGLLGVHNPETVVDLDVGEGSLLMGANDHWGEAALHGIDIDQSNLDVARGRLGRGTYGKADCLSAGFPPAITELLSSADVVLCNPPFLEFAYDAGGAVPSQDWRQTAEVKFFEISLQLLRHGGSLGIIFPARYVSGPAYREFRKQLLRTCNVVSVTHLPLSTFKTAEVEAYYLVLRKEPPAGRILLQALDDEGQLSIAISVSAEDAIGRMDYRFHHGVSSWLTTSVPLAMLLIQDACRGIESQGRSTPSWIFHTSAFRMFPDGNVECPTKNSPRKTGVATVGDILVPRVGSRCLHHCARVVSGETAFSDCVYRLTVAPEWRNYVFAYLRSPVGIAMRRLVAHGTCVKILGKQALLDLPVPLVSLEDLERL